MFARITRLNLKPWSRVGYTQAIDDEIFPKMKKCDGFAGQTLLISSDGKGGIGTSLRHGHEDSEAYQRKAYGAVMRVTEKFTAAKPEVHTCDVTNSATGAHPVRKAA